MYGSVALPKHQMNAPHENVPDNISYILTNIKFEIKAKWMCFDNYYLAQNVTVFNICLERKLKVQFTQ